LVESPRRATAGPPGASCAGPGCCAAGRRRRRSSRAPDRDPDPQVGNPEPRPYFPGLEAMLETVKLSSLVTCIVERDRSRWSLIWASDGKTPRDFSADSLTTALDEASSQTAALYAN